MTQDDPGSNTAQLSDNGSVFVFHMVLETFAYEAVILSLDAFMPQGNPSVFIMMPYFLPPRWATINQRASFSKTNHTS